MVEERCSKCNTPGRLHSEEWPFKIWNCFVCGFRFCTDAGTPDPSAPAPIAQGLLRRHDCSKRRLDGCGSNHPYSSIPRWNAKLGYWETGEGAFITRVWFCPLCGADLEAVSMEAAMKEKEVKGGSCSI